MKVRTLSLRNAKELMRDPLSLIFGVGLPLFILVIISFLQKNIGVAIFEIGRFAPGVAVFSFSFITMFSGMLISRDRTDSLLTRLYASPLAARDYIAGYSLPLLPIAAGQGILCLACAIPLGLPLSLNLLAALAALILIAPLFIALGILFGCRFTDKQVGGVSSILIQISAFTSGMWFDLDMVGGAFRTVSHILPFSHAMKAVELALGGGVPFSEISVHIAVVLAYTLALFAAAALVFRRQMKN